MEYFLNPNELCSCFAVPLSIAEKHIKIASGNQIKILLWAIKNNNFNINNISSELCISESSVEEALAFWADLGVLLNKNESAVITTSAEKSKSKPIKSVRPTAIKPGRTEVARRGIESPDIAFLLQEAQIKCGRALKQNEASTLVWLYDDEGLDVSLILMLLEFAASEGKFSISFIEKTAIDWINSGVQTIADAEAKIIELTEQKTAWNEVRKVFNIEKRMASTNELKYSYTWVKEWGFKADILKAAYDTCVDSTGKFSIPYINKVLTNWKKNNVKTLDDINNLNKKNNSKTNSSYDFESIKNSMLSE